jgi:hypothetical protein
MPRTPIPIDELHRLMLEEIRKHDGCEGVTDVSIYHVTDNQTDANWSVGVIGCGNAGPDAAKRAAINAQSPHLFEQACKMGLEGIVSKHRERTYKARRSTDWIKVKNPKSPAMLRAKDGPW